MYRDAYGLTARELRPGWPLVYGVRGLLGGLQFSTDPYVTDSAFPDDPEGVLAYLEACRGLLAETGAHHVLLKFPAPVLSTPLPPQVATTEGFSKARLDLRGGEEAVWMGRLSARTRNKVRNGQKVGIDFRSGRHELLDAFYQVIARTQTDLGTPVHARRFFAAILEHHDDSSLLVGFLAERPVSAALLVTRDGRVRHPYTGTVGPLKARRVNHALYWRIVQWGLARGCHTFDMGRSQAGSGNEEFKRRFGGERTVLGYAYVSKPGAAVPDFGASWVVQATRAWRHLPLPVARWLGPWLIRGVP